MSDINTSPPARQSVNLNWLVFFLLLLVGVLVLRTLYPNISPLLDPTAESRAVTPRGDLAEDEKATIEIFREASPSVVHIATITQVMLNSEIYDQTSGFGSGFIWSDEGYVVTNYHVIQSSRGAKVTLANGTTHDARFVGASADFDLAVLKIDVPMVKLKPLMLGESKNLQVGQKVFAIGSPFGLDQTLTTGVIGGLGRQIPSRGTNHTIQGVIQTDAAINPGNSGGPLLDSAGRLIGVNTMIYSPTGANAGIGYAVPVDTVNRVVPQLIQTGQVVRPVLGIAIWADQTVQNLVRLHTLPREGVLVLAAPYSGNEENKNRLLSTRRTSDGQMVLGDLIIRFNDMEIKDSSDLNRALDEHKVGDEVDLLVLRDEKEFAIRVKLRAPESGIQTLGDDDIPDPTGDESEPNGNE